MQIVKRNLSKFDENSVKSFLIEIFRRLNAHSTPFYTLNVMIANFSDEIIPANRKTQSFKIRRKLCKIVLIEIFLRLDSHSTPNYTPNVAHDNFSTETIPAYRKTQSFKFRRKLC
jgi:hypothetical protein